MAWAVNSGSAIGMTIQTDELDDGAVTVPKIAADTTLKVISKQTLSVDAASISFTGLDGTYKKFIILGNLRTKTATVLENIKVELNADTTATNYYRQRNYVTTTTTSNAASNDNQWGVAAGDSAPAGIFSTFEMFIDNTGTAIFRSTSGSYQTTTNMTGYWNTSASLTTITIKVNSGADFAAGSELILLGVE